MRILVVAENTFQLRELVGFIRRAGHQPCGAVAALEVTEAVRRLRPEALIVEQADEGTRHAVIERAWGAAESDMPALLVVPRPEDALHSGPFPTTVVRANGTEEGILSGLRALVSDAATSESEPPAVTPLHLNPGSRDVEGPTGKHVRLTVSEVSVLAELIAAAGMYVGPAALSSALWGVATVDRHSRAAIRTHIYTLRRKLRSVGLDEAIVSLSGVGYRLAREDAAS